MLSIEFPQRVEQIEGSSLVQVFPGAVPKHPVAHPILSLVLSSQTSFEAIKESPQVEVQI